MQGAPFFSIIIPTKDRASLLKECIDSVIKQHFVDYELIIVDNGSSDNTQTIIKQFDDKRIKTIILEKPDRSEARNLGLSHSKGKYICFVDDDDLLGKNYLQFFYNYLEKNIFPEKILRTGYSRMTERGKIQKPLYNKGKHKNPVRYAALNLCGVWTLCIPRSFLEKDKFPIGFPHWQDTHLILRLFAQYPFVQLPHYQYFYRIHSARGSAKVDSSNQLNERASLNVKAIKDLFANYGSVVSPFLENDAASFLFAEKLLQYAIVAQNHKYYQLAKELFRKSKNANINLRLWKSYLIYTKQALLK